MPVDVRLPAVPDPLLPPPANWQFNSDADNLILGLQQYREFVGTYPTGNNLGIAKALLGRTEKKVLLP